MLPHDTGIVTATKAAELALFKDDLIATFVDSVDVAFLFAAIVIVLLVPIGILYRGSYR